MTSGATNGISASERWSAPTSSSAIISPRPRIVSTRASISAGLSVSARSVSSTTTSSSAAACSNSAVERGGMSTSSSDGSTLTNSVLRRRASKAPCSAAARQAHSSSSSSPHARAASNSRSGRSNAEPTGPRARASYATTSRVSRSTIGWYRERMRPPSRISRSSAASAASSNRIAVISPFDRQQSAKHANGLAERRTGGNLADLRRGRGDRLAGRGPGLREPPLHAERGPLRHHPRPPAHPRHCSPSTTSRPRSTSPATPPSSTPTRSSASRTKATRSATTATCTCRSDAIDADAQREEIERGLEALAPHRHPDRLPLPELGAHAGDARAPPSSTASRTTAA